MGGVVALVWWRSLFFVWHYLLLLPTSLFWIFVAKLGLWWRSLGFQPDPTLQNVLNRQHHNHVWVFFFVGNEPIRSRERGLAAKKRKRRGPCERNVPNDSAASSIVTVIGAQDGPKNHVSPYVLHSIFGAGQSLCSTFSGGLWVLWAGLTISRRLEIGWLLIGDTAE